MSITADKNMQYAILNVKKLKVDINSYLDLMMVEIEMAKLEGRDCASVYFSNDVDVSTAGIVRDILQDAGLNTNLDPMDYKVTVTW